MRTRTQRFLRAASWFALVASVMVVVFVGHVGWRLHYGVSLRVVVNADRILVDTQQLGEYYSALSRIRVTDPQDRRTVWEVVSTSESGLSPVWTFDLVSGDNHLPGRLSQTFRTTIPSGGGQFKLKPGRRYRVDVWGPSVRHHNARMFIAPPSTTSVEETHNNVLQLSSYLVTVRAFARSAPS